MFYVYVASKYENASFVRDVLHEKLEELGMMPTSRWVERARGPEDFASMTAEALRQAAGESDHDIRGSDVLFVYDPAAAGGETYAEARWALSIGRPVVWYGRRILSMWREGVVRVDDLDAALAQLVAMREHHARGVRGQLLALVRSAA